MDRDDTKPERPTLRLKSPCNTAELALQRFRREKVPQGLSSGPIDHPEYVFARFAKTKGPAEADIRTPTKEAVGSGRPAAGRTTPSRAVSIPEPTAGKPIRRGQLPQASADPRDIFYPKGLRIKGKATKLKKLLNAYGHSVKHMQAQELFARMLGHASWRALNTNWDLLPPSEFDEFAPADTVASRERYQVAVLVAWGVDAGIADIVIQRLRPTGGKFVNDEDVNMPPEDAWEGFDDIDY